MVGRRTRGEGGVGSVGVCWFDVGKIFRVFLRTFRNFFRFLELRKEVGGSFLVYVKFLIFLVFFFVFSVYSVNVGLCGYLLGGRLVEK